MIANNFGFDTIVAALSFANVRHMRPPHFLTARFNTMK